MRRRILVLAIPTLLVLSLLFNSVAGSAEHGTVTPAPATTSRAQATSRMHYVVSMGCSGNQTYNCITKADEVEANCEYRNEDGGTPYSSCFCQHRRFYKQCMEECGTYDHQMLIELSPECFTSQ